MGLLSFEQDNRIKKTSMVNLRMLKYISVNILKTNDLKTKFTKLPLNVKVKFVALHVSYQSQLSENTPITPIPNRFSSVLRIIVC